MNIASVYASMGDEATAMQWLETALKDRDPNLTWIGFDKEFEFLKSNPRFQYLLHEVGLIDKKVYVPIEPVRARASRNYLLVFAFASLVLIAFLTFLFFER